MIRNQPAYARAKVLERDKGVCATCGRDCVALEGRVSTYATAFGHGIERGEEIRLWSRRRRLELWFRRFGLVWGNSLWQADHIIPVVEGGGGCGLDNLRTLCVCCHKAETRALAARRAWLRKRRAAWDAVQRLMPIAVGPQTSQEEFEYLAVDAREAA